MHLIWCQTWSHNSFFFDKFVYSMLKIAYSFHWSFVVDILVVTNLSSSNVAHDIYCNYLRNLSKKLTFFGSPQLNSSKYLVMRRRDIHLPLQKSMIFVVFWMLLLLLLLRWPQYIQLNLGEKWWNLRLWCKVRWCVVLYSITLDVTGIHWRPFIHGRINWWWWIHVKLIWMKWECRILKNCYIRSILWVG